MLKLTLWMHTNIEGIEYRVITEAEFETHRDAIAQGCHALQEYIVLDYQKFDCGDDSTEWKYVVTRYNKESLIHCQISYYGYEDAQDGFRVQLGRAFREETKI